MTEKEFDIQEYVDAWFWVELLKLPDEGYVEEEEEDIKLAIKSVSELLKKRWESIPDKGIYFQYRKKRVWFNKEKFWDRMKTAINDGILNEEMKGKIEGWFIDEVQAVLSEEDFPNIIEKSDEIESNIGELLVYWHLREKAKDYILGYIYDLGRIEVIFPEWNKRAMSENYSRYDTYFTGWFDEYGFSNLWISPYSFLYDWEQYHYSSRAKETEEEEKDKSAKKQKLWDKVKPVLLENQHFPLTFSEIRDRLNIKKGDEDFYLLLSVLRESEEVKRIGEDDVWYYSLGG